MFIPEQLGTLFHNVVPSIDFTFLIFVKQVERCSRKWKNSGIILLQLVHHTHTGSSINAFVCFVNHYEVPIILHNGTFQWIKSALLATNKLWQAQILHADKEYEYLFASIHLVCKCIEVTLRVIVIHHSATISRFKSFCMIVSKGFRGTEYLRKVIMPSFIYNRAMGDDERRAVATTLSYFKTWESLSKAHFGIPEIVLTLVWVFELLLEVFYCVVNCLFLLRAELDGTMSGTLALLYLADNILYIKDGAGKPNIRILSLSGSWILILAKSLWRNIHGTQGAIDIISLIAFGVLIVCGTFHIFYMVWNSLHVRTSIEYSTNSLPQLLAVWGISYIIINKDLTNFEKSLVLPVVDAEHVQEAWLGYSVSHLAQY